MTLTEIYNKHHNAVYNYVLSVLKNVHDAEEVANNVFIKIHRLPSAEYDKKHGAAMSTWVRLIAYQQIIDHIRTTGKKGSYYKAVSDFADGQDQTKSYFDFVAPKNDNADQMVLSQELHQRIRRAFSTLKPKYRAIAKLYFLNDLPYTEISELLEIPMGSIKATISRARQVLQDKLEGVRGYKMGNVQSIEA